jgi:hypothetical protein
MPKHGHARLEAGFALHVAGEKVADSALGKPDVSESVLLRLPLALSFELGDPRAFRDHDDAEQLSLPAPAVQVRDHLLERDLELRDEDQVGPAGDAPHHSDPARVTTHDLDHHHAMVCGGGRVQPVERFGDHSDGGVEADAELGHREVVVDRLRNSHGREACLVQRGPDAQRVVAADWNERVDPAPPQRLDHARDSVFLFQGVGARRAEDRAAQGQDSPHARGCQLIDQSLFDAPGPAVLHAAHLVPELERAPGHCADRSIEPGSVAAAGQDSDSHADRLRRPVVWSGGGELAQQLGEGYVRKRTEHEVGLSKVKTGGDRIGDGHAAQAGALGGKHAVG